MSSPRRSRSLALLLPATLLVVASCSSAVEPDAESSLGSRVGDCSGPATSLDPARAAALPPRSPAMHPDTRWAELAARVPGGFAGVLYEDGRPLLMLVHPEQGAAAKSALAPLLPDFDVAGASVRRARWDFAQLVDWYDYLTVATDVWATPGITLGDKDERLNRIVFGVTDAAARERLETRLGALDLPCDLVAVTVSGPITTRLQSQ